MKLADFKKLKTSGDIIDLILRGPIGGICDLLITHKANKIICPSPHLAQLIRSYCFADEKKICVIPNGIDLKTFDEVKDNDVSILSKYGLEKDNYVLFMGRLSFLKGVQYLIAAFRTIKKEFPNLKLAIVGKGDFEKFLRNLAYGMEEVVFIEYVDSLKVKKILYENSLIVVVPSLYEASPMVVLEAMACSRAIIASNVGSIPFLVKHGKSGFLSNPGDSKNLEKFIKILYSDWKMRKNMGSFGRKLVEKDFTDDCMVDQTLKVYKSLC